MILKYRALQNTCGPMGPGPGPGPMGQGPGPASILQFGPMGTGPGPWAQDQTLRCHDQDPGPMYLIQDVVLTKDQTLRLLETFEHMDRSFLDTAIDTERQAAMHLHSFGFAT